MPHYYARCISATGARFAFEIEAPNVAALRLLVEGRKSFLVSHRELRTRAPARRIRIPPAAQAQLFHLLALQLEHGVPTDLAVAKLMREFPDRRARAVLQGVHFQLSTARATLSDALAQYPRSFSENTVATLRVGEQTGALGLAARFSDLRDQIRFRLRLRQAAFRALAYPGFILLFAAGVVGLLLVRLVPLVRELLDNLHAPLPPLTLAILALSAWLRQSVGWLVLAAAIAAAGFRCLRLWSPTALLLDRLWLRLPVTGPVFQALVTAELAKTYRALYSAGASAPESLAACAAVSRNRALRAALLRSRRALETGELTAGKPEAPAITEALRSTGYFPELALTIISTGETSGSLLHALDAVAEHYAQSAQDQLLVLFAVFDKALLLLLLGIIGAIVIGIWQPILAAAQYYH